MNTRQTILVSVAILLVGAVAVWWYLGFSLGFMRFFAGEPGVLQRSVGPLPSRTGISVTGCRNIPSGCTCQQVECLNIQAPCDPIIVCPSGTPPSGAVSCSPATQTVGVGSGAQLSAAGGGGATYNWFAPEGIIAMPDVIGTFVWKDFLVNYDSPGIKKVTVQAPRGDGINTDSVACTVIVVPAEI